eukprot:TRINITY_DN14214_c0_g1_i1.p1 TRINITY_DN14214_c0_g1~~TRINITY_DN14214_c0_g1_i1.p1  ORF type:complete len:617 (+),score=95.81 TRINITY_DN14214_c0_g1_i1:59-1909(+)
MSRQRERSSSCGRRGRSGSPSARYNYKVSLSPMVPVRMPPEVAAAVAKIKTSAADDKLNSVMECLDIFSYSRAGPKFNIDKARKVSDLLVTAEAVLLTGKSIQCIEATILCIKLTHEIDGLVRFPLSFESRCPKNQKTFKHLVLGTVYNNKFGAFGKSRSPHLACRQPGFDSLNELIDSYILGYKKEGQTVLSVTVGERIRLNEGSDNVLWDSFYSEIPVSDQFATNVEESLKSTLPRRWATPLRASPSPSIIRQRVPSPWRYRNKTLESPSVRVSTCPRSLRSDYEESRCAPRTPSPVRLDMLPDSTKDVRESNPSVNPMQEVTKPVERPSQKPTSADTHQDSCPQHDKETSVGEPDPPTEQNNLVFPPPSIPSTECNPKGGNQTVTKPPVLCVKDHHRGIRRRSSISSVSRLNSKKDQEMMSSRASCTANPFNVSKKTSSNSKPAATNTNTKHVCHQPKHIIATPKRCPSPLARRRQPTSSSQVPSQRQSSRDVFEGMRRALSPTLVPRLMFGNDLSTTTRNEQQSIHHRPPGSGSLHFTSSHFGTPDGNEEIVIRTPSKRVPSSPATRQFKSFSASLPIRKPICLSSPTTPRSGPAVSRSSRKRYQMQYAHLG